MGEEAWRLVVKDAAELVSGHVTVHRALASSPARAFTLCRQQPVDFGNTCVKHR